MRERKQAESRLEAINHLLATMGPNFSENVGRLITLLAREIGAEIGLSLKEAAVGGGSDGNFTAALGIPTLDGLGAVGEGAHAVNESVVVEELIPRTVLLARLMEEI